FPRLIDAHDLRDQFLPVGVAGKAVIPRDARRAHGALQVFLQRAAPAKPSARSAEKTALPPAMEIPSTRMAGSSQLMRPGWFNAASKSPVLMSATPPVQAVGPCHQWYSTPA